MHHWPASSWYGFSHEKSLRAFHVFPDWSCTARSGRASATRVSLKQAILAMAQPPASFSCCSRSSKPSKFSRQSAPPPASASGWSMSHSSVPASSLTSTTTAFSSVVSTSSTRLSQLSPQNEYGWLYTPRTASGIGGRSYSAATASTGSLGVSVGVGVWVGEGVSVGVGDADGLAVEDAPGSGASSPVAVLQAPSSTAPTSSRAAARPPVERE